MKSIAMAGARAARNLLQATALVLALGQAAQANEAAELYRAHCAACHGADRFGGIGPALLPSNLERLRRPAAEQVIAGGLAATQMPGFARQLSAAQIKALAAYIHAEPDTPPVWGLEQIRASRIEHANAARLPAKPVFDADPLNLFIVVETGDHHVTVLDGDRFVPLARFQSRRALHGGPKFSPEGRFVYFASRDGWISKYDLWNLTLVAEIRAGLNTRNVAVSGDGKYVMAGNYLPHTLVVLDAELQPVKLLPVLDRAGRKSSRVSAVYDARPRKSFVAALKDIAEVWEISYDPAAPDVPAGPIHDFRHGEGAFVRGFLNPQRSLLDDYLDDFFFTPDYSELMGASREARKGQVVHLDVRRKIADLDLPGMPHLGSGITFEHDGRRVMATPNLREGLISVIDINGWKLLRQIETNGPGFFLRSHEKTPYAWVDAMMSKDRNDTLQIIDKRTLQVVGSVRPAPGKTAAHVEFSRDGRHALVSVWDMEGALVVYDAASFKEVKRIPMRRPVGKYNVHNKITKSEGTSH
jgi:mono/diheme cytochrome c family protein/DNA-binding beta-propeller fold protein YncE